MVLLAVWFAWFAVAGDWIYQVHTRWFQIPRQSFDAIHYAGMAVTKIAIILFFLLPWIAIKLMSGKRTNKKRGPRRLALDLFLTNRQNGVRRGFLPNP